MSQPEAVCFEVEIKENTPRKKKPTVQSRLESSPRPASTPEKFIQRQQEAQDRRLSLEKQIKQKAQAEVEKAKRVAETVKSTRKEGDKENVATDAN